jgi:hypothetical protein
VEDTEVNRYIQTVKSTLKKTKAGGNWQLTEMTKEPQKRANVELKPQSKRCQTCNKLREECSRKRGECKSQKQRRCSVLKDNKARATQ